MEAPFENIHVRVQAPALLQLKSLLPGGIERVVGDCLIGEEPECIVMSTGNGCRLDRLIGSFLSEAQRNVVPFIPAINHAPLVPAKAGKLWGAAKDCSGKIVNKPNAARTSISKLFQIEEQVPVFFAVPAPLQPCFIFGKSGMTVGWTLDGNGGAGVPAGKNAGAERIVLPQEVLNRVPFVLLPALLMGR